MGKSSFNDIAQAVLANDSFLIPPSEEEIDPSEYKYFCFPNYSKNGITINEVADCSQPDLKRLKAHMFIGDITEKGEILNKIDTAIEWLKTVKNPPSPKYPQKHGNMPADSIYLNVYKYDERRNKELLPNNENFVCFVDYNQSGTTTLKDGESVMQYIVTLFDDGRIVINRNDNGSTLDLINVDDDGTDGEQDESNDTATYVFLNSFDDFIKATGKTPLVLPLPCAGLYYTYDEAIDYLELHSKYEINNRKIVMYQIWNVEDSLVFSLTGYTKYNSDGSVFYSIEKEGKISILIILDDSYSGIVSEAGYTMDELIKMLKK